MGSKWNHIVARLLHFTWNGSILTLNRLWKVKNACCVLPWRRSGWESACQCRGHGFEPWSGKIPHAAEQLRPWATTTEPARLEPVLRKKRGRDSERPVHRDEEWPPLAPTRESPRTENEDPTQPKINKINFKKKYKKRMHVVISRATLKKKNTKNKGKKRKIQKYS